MSPPETDNCHKCQSEISTDATVCPNCSFNPAKSAKRATTILVILGVAISFTGTVGFVLGIIAIVTSLGLWYKARESTPVNPVMSG